MKVYVITKGEYSDYHICAVSLDEDEANLLAKKFSDRWDKAEVEIFDTDDNKLFQKANMYLIRKYDNGVMNIQNEDFTYDMGVTELRDGSMYTYVNADTEEEALKIASDKFAQYKAENLDL